MATGNSARHSKKAAARRYAYPSVGIVRQQTTIPVVNIKTPPGRTDSIQRFFTNLPVSCGVTFVISTSSLTQQNQLFLHSAKSLHKPCYIAGDGMKTRPDAIYIVPVEYEAEVSDGILRLRKADKLRSAPARRVLTRLEQESRQLRSGLEAAFQKIAASAEHRRIEERLRAERERLTSILEAFVDGIYIVNHQFDMEYVNPALKASFGEPQGRKCYTFFRGRNAICPDCRIEEVLRGNTVQWEWHWAGKAFNIIDTPLHNADGSVSQLGILRDIAERVKSEQVLRPKDSVTATQ